MNPIDVLQIKLECLKLAATTNESSAEQILNDAKAFYDFIVIK